MMIGPKPLICAGQLVRAVGFGGMAFADTPSMVMAAMFLAGLLAQSELSSGEMLDRYELYIYKQWLRVYMRSKMIKHNKDLFESLDDPLALLEKLHIY